MTTELDHTAQLASQVLDAVDLAVVGKRSAIEQVLLGVLAGGHVLIEDLPGLGKTLIARSLAQVLGLDFTRLQFTPDLLPSDVDQAFVIAKADDGASQRDRGHGRHVLSVPPPDPSRAASSARHQAHTACPGEEPSYRHAVLSRSDLKIDANALCIGTFGAPTAARWTIVCGRAIEQGGCGWCGWTSRLIGLR